MSEDRNLISSQTHELNYVLKKWDKKQSKKNREILRGVLKDFRADQSYKPHNRGNFYKYAEDNDILKLLEDEKKKQSKAGIMPDIDTGKLTVEDPYIHRDKTRKGKKKKISLHELTMQKGPALTQFKPGEKATNTKGGGKKGSKKKIIIILICILAAVLIITLICVGTCIFQQSGKTGSSSTEENTTFVEPGEENPEDDSSVGREQETEEVSYTLDSLKDYIKTNTPLYFKGDLDELVEGEDEKINKLASYLNNYSFAELSIQGHTASIGEPDDEMVLSKMRAELIAELLKGKVKNIELKIQTTGYGAKKEAIHNPSKENMKLNRRVEITVIQAN